MAIWVYRVGICITYSNNYSISVNSKGGRIMSIFKEKIFDKIRQSAYAVYQEGKTEGIELTVNEIYDRLNKNIIGKSGLNMQELCERGGVPDKEVRRAILEGIKTPSIDNLA